MKNISISSKRAKQLKKLQQKRELVARLSRLTDQQVAEIARPSDQFNSSSEWKALRNSIVAKYGTVCMCCKRDPKNKKHVNVDHIKPRKFYPELALDPDNLQILCSTCNKNKGNKHCTDYRPK